MDTTSRRHGKTDRAVAASNPVVKPAAELIGFYGELNAECAECEFPASQEKFEARNLKSETNPNDAMSETSKKTTGD